ncbi:hypothetical protein QUF84_25170 [Fictibacillus enclensis]|nr:hypothetical protein [Fictibacillus enclensis]MDM5340489.1 hypothetical protein [Fictibacillus enclensis]
MANHPVISAITGSNQGGGLDFGDKEVVEPSERACKYQTIQSIG